MTPDELPELHQGILDLPTLRELFDDLDLYTQIVEVHTKGGPREHADAQVSFTEAARAFQARSIRGLQVRYVWEGEPWIDTLSWTAEGPRVVRMRAPRLPSE